MMELTNIKELYLNITSSSDLAPKAEPYMFCFSKPLSISRPFQGNKGAYSNPNIYQVEIGEGGQATYATISRGRVKTTIYHKGENCFRFVLSGREQRQSVLLIDNEGKRTNISLTELIKGE